MNEKKRCCCNCRNCIRCKDGKGFVTHCQCAIDSHYIGYVECFDGWCNRWRKDHTFDGAEEPKGE